MSIHLTPALEQDLQHLAAQSHTTVDDFAQRALEEFIAYRRDFNEAVKQDGEAFEAGRFLEHHDVVARMQHLLGHRETFVAAVHEGIAAGERGELAEHEEVVAMLADVIANG